MWAGEGSSPGLILLCRCSANLLHREMLSRLQQSWVISVQREQVCQGTPWGTEAWDAFVEDRGFCGGQARTSCSLGSAGCHRPAGCSRGRVVLDFPHLMIFSCMSVQGYCEKQFIMLLYFTEEIPLNRKAMWPACDSREPGKTLSVNE